MNKLVLIGVTMVTAFAMCGCATKTRRVVAGETVQTVAGFSEDDINDCVAVAVQSVVSQDRIKLQPGATRAVVIVEDVINDTTARGSNAAGLAEALGQSLREELTSCGKVVVYNKEAAQYAKVVVEPQYRLSGKLRERNLRQDDGDFQKEYHLNLTLVELATGLEFWQKRIPIRKIVDKNNVMY